MSNSAEQFIKKQSQNAWESLISAVIEGGSDLVKTLIETSRVGVVLVNSSGQIVFANTAAERTLGLTKETITSRTYNDPGWKIVTYDGEPFPDHMLPFSRVMESHKPVVDVRHAILRSDGERVLLSINASPLFSGGGEFIGMAASIEDVTEQVIAELNLRASEAKFRSIVESSPMGIHMYRLCEDDKLVLTGTNSAADRITGVDHSQLVGKTLEEAFPPLVETELPDRFRRAAALGESWKTENIDYRQREISIAFEVHAFQTSPGHMAAFFLDVTERKKAEQREQTHVEELSFLSDTAMRLGEFLPDGDLFQFICDRLRVIAEDAIILVNSYDEKSNRIKSEAMAGLGERREKTLQLLGRQPEDLEADLPDEIKQSLISGHLIELEKDIFEHFGKPVSNTQSRALRELFEVDKTYSMGLFRKDKLFGTVGIVTRVDRAPLRISLVEAFVNQAAVAMERRRAEKERAEIEEQLLHTQKLEAVGALAGGVAHDFNNLLAGVLGQTFLLKRRVSPDSDTWKNLDIIENAGKRAAELTSKLLGFARKGKLRNIPVDLSETINDTIGLLGHAIDKRIALVNNLSPELPLVWGDPGQLQQILMNLAVNARDAMPNGGKIVFDGFVVEISNGSLPDGTDTEHSKFLCLTVSDNGEGIPEDIRGRVFEPFFTTKGRDKGTGMGLAMVYGIVKSHGGWIDLESEMGMGSTFSVYLPATDDMMEQKDDTHLQAPLEGRGKILLVDDEELIRDTLGEMLRELGYDVICAGSGGAALDCITDIGKEIKLVLLDVTMPDMNGVTCYSLMRERGFKAPVLALTGHRRTDVSLSVLLREGVLDIIEKPFHLATLSRKIENAIRR